MHNKSKEKIVFTIPDSLISEVDHIVKMENSNREDFAKAAFQFYITQKLGNNFFFEAILIQH